MNNQNSSKTWLIALAVIVVGGILVYQFWAAKKGPTPSELAKQKQQILKEMAEEAKKWPKFSATGFSKKTVPEIIRPGQNSWGWKTYQNKGVGYQLKYPAKWIVMRRQFLDLGTNCKYKENLAIQNMAYVSSPDNGPKTGSAFLVRVFQCPASSNLTIKKWIDKMDIPTSRKQKMISRISTMKIAGADRKVFKGLRDFNWQQGITFVDKNKVYQLVFFSGSPEQFKKDLNTFKKMFSSFKVID